MNATIAVIAAHPDDETLGCGGTLLNHIAAGDDVHLILATEPIGDSWDDAFRVQREEELQEVVLAYPLASLQRLEFATTTLLDLPRNQLISALRTALWSLEPDVVYMPHPGDPHDDHRALSAAAGVLLRPGSDRCWPLEILAYEVCATHQLPFGGGRPFLARTYSDITDTIERKLSIFRLYHSEVHENPGLRSVEAIEALARLRGALAGVQYAEAFEPLFERR